MNKRCAILYLNQLRLISFIVKRYRETLLFMKFPYGVADDAPEPDKVYKAFNKNMAEELKCLKVAYKMAQRGLAEMQGLLPITEGDFNSKHKRDWRIVVQRSTVVGDGYLDKILAVIRDRVIK